MVRRMSSSRQWGSFGRKIFVENLENGGDFGSGPRPVCGREREQREGVNAEMRRATDDAASGLCTGAMAGGARKGAGSGPAAVAVADNRDVELRCRNWDGRMRMENGFFQDRVMHEHDSFSAAD